MKFFNSLLHVKAGSINELETPDILSPVQRRLNVRIAYKSVSVSLILNVTPTEFFHNTLRKMHHLY